MALGFGYWYAMLNGGHDRFKKVRGAAIRDGTCCHVAHTVLLPLSNLPQAGKDNSV